MIYRALADFVLVIHLGFVLFVVFGGFLAIRWRWLIWLHLPAAIWGAAIEFAGWICPLTPLENWLRQAGGEAGYSGGFVEHYLVPVVYPAELSRQLQVTLGLCVIVINIVAYALVWSRRLKPP